MPALVDLQRPVSWQRGVRPLDVAWLARQLSTTETAGLPIKRALDTMAAQRAGTPIGVTVEDICRRLADGEDLSTAFRAHEDSLGAVTVALVSAGAASGSLANAFGRVAEMTEQQVALRRRVRGALTYPAVVGVVSLALTSAMLLFVVPTFRGMYTELNGKLPIPTRMLLAVSTAARGGVWIAAALAICAVLLYRSWRTKPANQRRVDLAKVRAPVLGSLLAKAAVGRVASTLAGLLDAGVTTLVAMDLAGASAGLAQYAEGMAEVGFAVRSGRSLAAALADQGLWPDTMVQLVEVGEETGKVGDLLARYAEISRQEVSAEVDRVVNLIEPAMVVGIGAIIGATVICLYLPLFDLINLIK